MSHNCNPVCFLFPRLSSCSIWCLTHEHNLWPLTIHSCNKIFLSNSKWMWCGIFLYKRRLEEKRKSFCIIKWNSLVSFTRLHTNYKFKFFTSITRLSNKNFQRFLFITNLRRWILMWGSVITTEQIEKHIENFTAFERNIYYVRENMKQNLIDPRGFCAKKKTFVNFHREASWIVKVSISWELCDDKTM